MKRLAWFPLLLAGCADTVSASVATPADAATALDAVTQDVAPRDDRPAPDAAVVASDECARGTWCWERPLPTGEAIAGAVARTSSDVAFVTVSGALARWDGARWRTTQLDLPAPVRALWASSSDELYLLCAGDASAPGAMPRAQLVRVRGSSRELLGAPIEGSGYILEGTAPDDLWTTTRGGVARWGGARWERIASPGGALITSIHPEGGGRAIALESWGSGSGTGRLHRLAQGEWSTLSSFEGLGVRAEGPIRAIGDSLYLRAWSTREGVPEIVRFDLERRSAALITPPVDSGSVEVYAVGGALWASYGLRLWRREGERWVSLPNLPSSYRTQLIATAPGDVWFFGQRAARLEGESWSLFGGPVAPTLGFWRDDLERPALVNQRPAGLAIRGEGADARWTLRELPAPGDALGVAFDGASGGWIALDAGLVRMNGREAGMQLPWPAPGRALRPFAGSATTLWGSGERGVQVAAGGVWRDALIEVPPIEGLPRSMPRVTAMHAVGAARALASTEYITGDKQVHVGVYSVDTATMSPIASLRGVFGVSAEVRFAGTLPAVWIAFDGLRRWDGSAVQTVETEVTPIDLQVAADGRVVGIDRERVYLWTASGRRVSAIPLPTIHEVHWQSVSAQRDGTIRVAARSGEVMRYNP